MGNFDDAIRGPLSCPQCQACDLPTPAKPTLEREPNGTYTCSMCGHNFKPPTWQVKK